jgi:Zn-dependent M16 (insulinase) family peptidase
MPKEFLLISDAESLQAFQDKLKAQATAWLDKSNNAPTTFALPPANQTVKQFWQANTQVHFCASAYPTVGSSHPDAAALTVLGGFLRNGYLHRAIREQGGAYGGGASQDSNSGAFRFYSYRDPRFTETLNDFDQSLAWLKNNKHDAQPLEEAILGVISAIDKPSSPAGDAKSTFHNNLHGRTPAQRREARNAVLKVQLKDLQHVAETYLIPQHGNTAVIGNQTSA